MNAKSIIVVIAFLAWSAISWTWYVWGIKGKFNTPKAPILVQLPDTLSQKPVITADTLSIESIKSVQELDHKTLLYFSSKATQFETDTLINTYLTKLSQKLIIAKDTIITIVGHTDDLGKDEDNLALSYQRAKDVQSFMLSKGAPIGKIKIEGKGEKDPVDADTTTAARTKNRRVEILFNKN